MDYLQSKNILSCTGFIALFCVSLPIFAQDDTVEQLVGQGEEQPLSDSEEKQAAEGEAASTPEKPGSEKAEVESGEQAAATPSDPKPVEVAESGPPKEKKPDEQAGLTREQTLLLLLPDKVDAKEGFEPPPGYELVEKKRTGLVVAGTTMFVLSYLKCLIFAGLAEEGTLAIPIVGPIIVIKEMEGLMFLFLPDAIGQLMGVIMIPVGANSTKKYWVRKKPGKVSFHFSPTYLGPKAGGIGLRGTF